LTGIAGQDADVEVVDEDDHGGGAQVFGQSDVV
jgi:hypothetical protein